ncbi:phage tail tape measure protein [Demequina gelatinilytica]|uniref:phage tail tape measure protein n=1 Tax=Demequina gelatinilytica TaxID=1638980 RepID=UPI0007809222|nr:phage tail tape measure protein [Demequina gelatinilytica]
MPSRRSMIFDILADAAPAKKVFDKFEEHALGVAASIAAGYAGTKLLGGLDDALAADASGDKVAAQLNLIPEAAQAASDAAKGAFRDGMGDSLEEVSRAVSEVGEDMVDLNKTSSAETQKMVTDALAIADAYDKDVSEVTRAAGQLMKNGLAADADEAFDIITTGMQGGLDKTDEFLDTLWEYSEPMSQLGLSGQDAIAMFGSALDSGAFSIDKAGDAMNEFATRAIDGSDSTAKAYEAIGLNAEQMQSQIAMGGPAAKTAFSEVVQALAGVSDAAEQDAAGVALFGSMWEDAGKEMVLSMDPAKQTLADVSDATENMSDTLYDNGIASAESMRRSFDGLWQDAMSLPGPFGTVAAGVKAFGGDLLAGAGAAGSLLVGLTNLGVGQRLAAVGTGIVTAAQWAWNAALNASPVMWIVTAIALLVAALVWAWNNVDWFREGLLNAWAFIKGAWSQVGPFFGRVKTRIVTAFRIAWNFLKTVFKWTPIGMVTSNWGKITKFFSGFKTRAISIFRGAWNFMKQVWKWTPFGMVTSNWGKITTWFGGFKERTVSIFRGAWNFIKKVWKWTPLGIITENWGKVVDWFGDLPGKVAEGFATVKDLLSEPFKNAFNAIASFWNNTAGKLHFTAPDWIPGIGGKGWGMPSIPLLASGAVAYGPTLAVVGEGSEPEAIAPLSKLASFMRGYLDEATVVSAPTSAGSSAVHVTTSLAGAVLEVRDADGVLLGRMKTAADQAVSAHRQGRRVAARARG